MPATVAAIEYDPNRSARIALLHYVDGAQGLHPGAGPARASARPCSPAPDADIKVGNCLPLSAIPTGTTVHAIELRPGQGARMVRSAGASAQLVATEEGRALLRLPSGELRRVPETCRATIGTRLATRRIRTSRAARPAARAGWASARRCAARP